MAAQEENNANRLGFSGVIVLMGVSGAGKSTLGAALAAAWQIPFVEGDTLHPASNRHKLSRGEALTDQDRAPWLEALAEAINREYASQRGVVATCSALKRVYRDRLRALIEPPVQFIFLDTPRTVLEQRLGTRQKHFMPASQLANQLQTLEPPQADENIICADGTLGPDALARHIRDAIASKE